MKNSLEKDLERQKEKYDLLEYSFKRKESSLHEQAACIAKLIEMNHQLAFMTPSSAPPLPESSNPFAPLRNNEKNYSDQDNLIKKQQATIEDKDREIRQLQAEIEAANEMIKKLRKQENEIKALLKLPESLDLSVSVVSTAIARMVQAKEKLANQMQAKEAKIKALILEKRELLEKIRELKHKLEKVEFQRYELQQELNQKMQNKYAWSVISQGVKGRKRRKPQNLLTANSSDADLMASNSTIESLPPIQTRGMTASKSLPPILNAGAASIVGKYCVICRMIIQTEQCSFHPKVYKAPTWTCCSRTNRGPGCLSSTHFYLNDTNEGRFLTNGNVSIIL